MTRGGGTMCPRRDTLSRLLLGLGIGLLLSLILPGGFLRVLVGLALIALGCLLSNCY